MDRIKDKIRSLLKMTWFVIVSILGFFICGGYVIIILIDSLWGPISLIVVKNLLIGVLIIITGTFIYTLITLSLKVRNQMIHRQNEKLYPEWKEKFKNYFMEMWMKNSFGVIMTILIIWFVGWVFTVFDFYYEYH